MFRDTHRIRRIQCHQLQHGTPPPHALGVMMTAVTPSCFKFKQIPSRLLPHTIHYLLPITTLSLTDFGFNRLLTVHGSCLMDQKCQGPKFLTNLIGCGTWGMFSKLAHATMYCRYNSFHHYTRSVWECCDSAPTFAPLCKTSLS